MFSMIVADNVGMFERVKDVELGLQLFALLLRHPCIVDLFPAKDL